MIASFVPRRDPAVASRLGSFRPSDMSSLALWTDYWVQL